MIQRWPAITHLAHSLPEVPRPTISVVVPVYNEAETLPTLADRLTVVLNGVGDTWELVLVNDGSTDSSLDLLCDLVRADARVRVIDFARNFGHQAAITAGLAEARGDAVIIMDADLQDPPEVLPDLIAAWRAGGEVVYAQRSSREGESAFKRASAALFYRALGRLTSVQIPPDTGDFRLLDRRVVDALVALPERHRYLRGLAAWVGFRQVAVPFQRQPRYAGETHYTLDRMLRLAWDAITSFSTAPLRLALWLGGALLVLSLLLASRGMLDAAGRSTALIVSAVAGVGGLQCVCLGILGMYLSRVYDEARGRPLYLVRAILEGGNDDSAGE